MKNTRRKVLCLIFLTAVFVFLTAVSVGAAGKKHLTLMIYMCGSDLESCYGAATADIGEIAAHAKNCQNVSILLMTGGSDRWKGFGSERTMIHEIGKNGIRTVWQAGEDDGRMNMGDGGTLRQLLKFATDRYEADDYALILWDHGGGPMSGICFDELYGMDSLTVQEMTEAIRGNTGHKKLKWIGFDACLMGNLEVASALVPCADYLIASEETEPASGWNYAFLDGLDGDVDARETGKRIVDAYFEAADDRGVDTLTLSCIDLSCITKLTGQIDALFAGLASGMDQDLFGRLARIRDSAAAMGKNGAEAGGEWFDLIDLGDLIRLLGDEGTDTEAVRQAMEEAVVYQRSNNERIHGLSIYHPYHNKPQYVSSWHDTYLRMNPGQGYADYVFRFGSLLTETDWINWGGLKTQYAGKDGNGNDLFQCRLSEAQAKGVFSARLLILIPHHFGSDAYMRIASVPAEIGPDGTLTAAYDGKSLYVSAGEDGLIGPLYSNPTSTEGTDAVPMVFQPKDEALSYGMTGAIMLLENDPAGGDPRILTYYIRDSATGTYTNRIPFQPELYSIIYFQDQFLQLPSIHDDGTYPGYDSWGKSQYLVWRGIDSGRDWHMAYVYDQLTGERLSAVFEITDAQQNSYCAMPAEVPNPYVHPVEAAAVYENEVFSLSLSGDVCTAPLQKEVSFSLHFTNRTDQTVSFRFENLLLNGTRTLPDRSSIDLIPGRSYDLQLLVSPEQLISITEIHSLACTVKIMPEKGYQPIFEMPVRFDFPEVSVAEIASAAEFLSSVTQDGVTWNLLDESMEEDGDLAFTFLIQNGSEQTVTPSDYKLLCNGIDNGSYCSFFSKLTPGSEALVKYSFYNDVRLGALGPVSVEGVTVGFRNMVVSDQMLQRHGFPEIEEIRLVRYPLEWDHIAGDVIRLPLREAVPVPRFVPQDQNSRWYASLPEDSGPENTERAVLAETADYTLEAGNVLLADDGIAVCLEIENKTDEFLEIPLRSMFLNGQSLLGSETYQIAPRSRIIRLLTVGGYMVEGVVQPGMKISAFSFTVKYLYDRIPPVVTLLFPEDSVLGLPGGRILTAGQMTVQKENPGAETPPPASEDMFETAELEDGTVEITGYSGMDRKVNIPSVIGGKTVSAIGAGAFYGMETPVSVILPETVTSVGRMAFAFCTNLAGITLPDSLVSIGEKAFMHCPGLTEIRIPDGVAGIGSRAFQDCSGLTAVSLPDSVAAVGDNPFSGCKNLTEISVSPDHPSLYVSDGALFSRPDQRMICLPCALDTAEYAVPQGTRILGGSAFEACSALTGVTIPDSVAEIGESAFSGCKNLSAVTIPESVAAIGEYAFGNCSGLTAITLPDSVTRLGAWAFANCSGLAEVTLSESLTEIEENTFRFCTGLTSVRIPDRVAVIRSNPFAFCRNLQQILVSPDHPVFTVTDGLLIERTEQRLVACPAALQTGECAVPPGIRTIGISAFSCCAAAYVTLPDSVAVIEENAFQSAALTGIAIPGSVVRIGDEAFVNCTALTDMVIPEGMTAIGRYLFQNCTALTGVTIPESVTLIDDGAFSSCSGLESLTIPAGVTQIGKNAFNWCDRLTLTVTKGSYAEKYCKSNKLSYIYAEN